MKMTNNNNNVPSIHCVYVYVRIFFFLHSICIADIMTIVQTKVPNIFHISLKLIERYETENSINLI